MPIESKISVGAINITIHPHSPEKYVSLIKDVKRRKGFAKIWGDQYGMITSASPYREKDGPTGPIVGDIYRFTNVDMDGEWFNTKTTKKAEDSEVEEISFPEYLKPNSSRFSYVFFPKEHLFFYEAYYDGHTLGPRNAVGLIDRLFNHPDIVGKYGKVDVSHVPEVDSLNDALRMSRLEFLRLKVTRPNPDENIEAEREVLRRMAGLNVEEYREEFKAVQGEGISVTPELETIAKVAAKNGEVFAKGKDSLLKPQKYSTKDHPMISKFYFDPVIESPFELMFDHAKMMKDTIMSWFK